MIKRTLALALSLAVLPLAARADDAERRWYGWHIMVVDAGALALVLAGAAGNSDVLLGLGAGALVLGGPMVHLADGGGGRRGLLSAALRLGLPIALGATAGATCDGDESDDWFGCQREVSAAALGGLLIAMIIDDAFLAYAPERPPRLQLSLTPRREGGLTIGLGGTF